MDIRSRKYSHSLTTKIIVFTLVVLFFSGILKSIANIEALTDDDFGIVFEDNYFLSKSYMQEVKPIITSLTQLVVEYKSEENISKGGAISTEDMRSIEESLYPDFTERSKIYNPSLSEEENFENFKKAYTKEINQAKNQMVTDDLKRYQGLMQILGEKKDLLYYATDGVNEFTNNTLKGQFKGNPSYVIYKNYKTEIYPATIEKNKRFNWITGNLHQLNEKNMEVSIAFTQDALNQKIKEWKEDKSIATKAFILFIGCTVGFLSSFVYLALIIGRKAFNDRELHLNTIDKLFNDVNVVLIMALISSWVALVDMLTIEVINKLVFFLTIPFLIVALVLILSIIKQIKNGTLLKHTLIYLSLSKFFTFIKNVYNSGSTGVKTVLLVVGYPILIALTFFIFPITIGFAAWFAYKQVKKFNAIKEGIEQIKAGDFNHHIEVDGKGEFASLANNINTITDGLKTAVNRELKSERMKTELITNVSHDIRTPLTSIITYVDLLKKEKDPIKIQEYVGVLDQKSQRLKLLTDDLFEAAKASSGTIPVHLERIDILSLLTQGLGEVNAKVEALDLTFKINHPKNKLFVTADGKLLWRSIENLLSNIFKYALRGSRVYIDIEDMGNDILLTFKNISAYELNISADELMERFKRGDESRNSQGSGLGLSIAKSLIEIQKGQFSIQVDGDLFKAMIRIPKQNSLIS
ncbi:MULTISPECIES: sensor histidine kinase [Bacillaceae]|uniref:histidine kinase n=1 Tax=Gottfriedia luciferensis TaxID=178774 RepID=A0ABX2ZRJ4_9BACI|nr:MULTISPECIES: sensor histidine kinase [Bacillaceae]ODG91811.1 two-component sensor histidine kinase [Gottfriedia luciferensis]PGZ94515.1 sensor histidine kinase [Bacillus sp. AFS029533]SFD80286.1 Signal transduction histidine kinase [Bacillus sp. UNCCL81]